MGEHVQHNVFGIHSIGGNFHHNTFMKRLVLSLVSRHFLFFLFMLCRFMGLQRLKGMVNVDKKRTLVGVNKTRENNTSVEIFVK